MKSSSRSRRHSAGIAVTATLGLALTGLATAPGAVAADPNTDASSASTGAPSNLVVVQLSAAPLATSKGVARGKDGRPSLDAGKTKNVRAQLAKQRNDLRSWLRKNAPQAKVTGQYDYAVNGVALHLNGASAADVAKAPGVVAVSPQATYTPLAAENDPDLTLIDAPEGWRAAGATSDESDPRTWAGYGTKVGIIDSGIDQTHPCFDDEGFPTTKPLGDAAYTTNKVIAARVFSNKLNQSGFDAAGVEAHGTHVAGTVACDLSTPAEVSGVDIPYDPSGVAPGAQLGNYNVFPGTVDNARSEDILNALQAAAEDGMDVLNMSLGGGYHGSQDILTKAVDNLDRADIVVAVSQGNEGPGYLTGGSPGSAERALTAGASSVGHLLGLPVYAGSTATGTPVSVTAAGDFPIPTDAPYTGTLSVTTGGTNATTGLSEACTTVTPKASAEDAIALVSRGTCAFTVKVANAAKAGYDAVIVVNNQPGDPIAMGGDGLEDPDVYAVMAPRADGPALTAQDGSPVTIGNSPAYSQTGNDDILADFSSWGPTRVDYRIKPDVTAPGVNVLSSVPATECEEEDTYDASIGCWAFFSGTSMSSPHLAGSAAVVRAAHPAWEAWQVRSAIVNTADREGVVDADGEPITDVLKVGSGLEMLDDAVDAQLALSRPSVSFGAVSKGSGKRLTQTVQVTNLTVDSLLAKPVVTGDSGPLFDVTGPSSIPGGGTATYTVSFEAPKISGRDATGGLAQATVDFGNAAHAALFAYLR